MVPNKAKMMNERKAARDFAPRMVTPRKRSQRPVVAGASKGSLVKDFTSAMPCTVSSIDGAGLGERVLRGLGVSPHLAPEEGDGQHHERHAAQHDQREFPRGDEDEGQSADQDHDLPDGLRHGGEQGVANHPEIARKRGC